MKKIKGFASALNVLKIIVKYSVYITILTECVSLFISKVEAVEGGDNKEKK